MKVLITGGMGVIGSMVSSRFVEEGHRPVIMARHLDRNLIRPIEDQVDIELGDILDLPRILSIIQSYNVTHIIHMAALIGALSNKSPPQSVMINVIGTLDILEAARIDEGSKSRLYERQGDIRTYQWRICSSHV